MNNLDDFLESTLTEKLLNVGKGIIMSIAVISAAMAVFFFVMWNSERASDAATWYGVALLISGSSFVQSVIALAVLEIERHLRPKDK